jgi:hypothetical protein
MRVPPAQVEGERVKRVALSKHENPLLFSKSARNVIGFTTQSTAENIDEGNGNLEIKSTQESQAEVQQQNHKNSIAITPPQKR